MTDIIVKFLTEKNDKMIIQTEATISNDLIKLLKKEVYEPIVLEVMNLSRTFSQMNTNIMRIKHVENVIISR